MLLACRSGVYYAVGSVHTLGEERVELTVEEALGSRQVVARRKLDSKLDVVERVDNVWHDIGLIESEQENLSMIQCA